MKLRVNDLVPTPEVTISCVLDNDGDVRILANGMEIAYIETESGAIGVFDTTHRGHTEALKSLGFSLDEENCVVIG